jgi:hypothetical protein
MATLTALYETHFVDIRKYYAIMQKSNRFAVHCTEVFSSQAKLRLNANN